MSDRRRNTPNRRAGRPRHVPYAGSAAPREQILDVAARLFVRHGFAATSTRDIADAVGIRQASLYYHFSGKDDILAELLNRSVRPTVDKIAKIEHLVPPETHETALYLLALVDVSTLEAAPHNIGLLSRLPDVTESPVYEQFRDARVELADGYGRLGASIARPPIVDLIGQRRLGEILIQVVDSAINMRSLGESPDGRSSNAVASTCLRICGCDDQQISSAASSATQLFQGFRDESLPG